VRKGAHAIAVPALADGRSATMRFVLTHRWFHVEETRGKRTHATSGPSGNLIDTLRIASAIVKPRALQEYRLHVPGSDR
jgi:hypothetical protein